MGKIFIVSDTFNSGELFKELNEKTQDIENLYFELEKEPENTMALDPTVLVALVGMGSAGVGAIITGLFMLAQKVLDNETKTDLAIIKIKSKEGEIEIPKGASEEEINKAIKALKSINSIQLITKL